MESQWKFGNLCNKEEQRDIRRVPTRCDKNWFEIGYETQLPLNVAFITNLDPFTYNLGKDWRWRTVANGHWCYSHSCTIRTTRSSTVSSYGRTILTRNCQELRSVPYAMTLWIQRDTFQRNRARHVRRNSIPIVSWSGSARATRASVLSASLSFYDRKEKST